MLASQQRLPRPSIRCQSLRKVPAIYKRLHTLPGKIRTQLVDKLSPERFHHVMGVEGLSVALAGRWGLDAGQATLAALLHDYAKPMGKKELEPLIIENPGFEPSKEDLRFPQMWHGLAAARLAREEFNIQSPEILEAVAWHTTGTKGLGPLGMVLFVSDFLEPTRNFPGVEKLRQEILPLPLEQAARRVAESKFQDIRGKGRPHHSRTLEMAQALGSSLTF